MYRRKDDFLPRIFLLDIMKLICLLIELLFHFVKIEGRSSIRPKNLKIVAMSNFLCLSLRYLHSISRARILPSPPFVICHVSAFSAWTLCVRGSQAAKATPMPSVGDQSRVHRDKASPSSSTRSNNTIDDTLTGGSTQRRSKIFRKIRQAAWCVALIVLRHLCLL